MERGTRLMDEGSSDEKCRECGRGIVTAVRCYDGKVDQQEAGKKQKKKKKKVNRMCPILLCTIEY